MNDNVRSFQPNDKRRNAHEPAAITPGILTMGGGSLGSYSQICKCERTAMHDKRARTGFCKFGRTLASGNIFYITAARQMDQMKGD